MKKSIIYSWVTIIILGILGIGFAVYYSFQEDDITKFTWTGTAYLTKDKWATVIADNNIYDADFTVTNKDGNQDDVLVQILDGKNNIIAGPTSLAVGETVTFSDIPWNSGTVLIHAKANIDGAYEFSATNQKLAD